MFSNKRNSSNLFLWGLAAGIFGGMYLARWMGQSGQMGNKSQDEDQPSAKRDNRHSKHSQHHQNSQHSQHSHEQMDTTNKDKLFETFMNASEDELVEKASQMNLKN